MIRVSLVWLGWDGGGDCGIRSEEACTRVYRAALLSSNFLQMPPPNPPPHALPEPRTTPAITPHPQVHAMVSVIVDDAAARSPSAPPRRVFDKTAAQPRASAADAARTRAVALAAASQSGSGSFGGGGSFGSGGFAGATVGSLEAGIKLELAQL